MLSRQEKEEKGRRKDPSLWRDGSDSLDSSLASFVTPLGPRVILSLSLSLCAPLLANPINGEWSKERTEKDSTGIAETLASSIVTSSTTNNQSAIAKLLLLDRFMIYCRSSVYTLPSVSSWSAAQRERRKRWTRETGWDCTVAVCLETDRQLLLQQALWRFQNGR